MLKKKKTSFAKKKLPPRSSGKTPPRYREVPFEDEEPLEDVSLSQTDFADLLVAPTDWTIDSISRQIGKQIDLNPDFQRRGVWTPKAKSKFIESLLLNIPIPQVLLASKPKEPNQFIVLDGKQRLLTIHHFLEGKHEDGTKFVLEDLQILTELKNKSWAQLKDNALVSDRLLNQTLRTAVLRGWENEDVLFEIFQRLNSGSVKLSPMELRMSLHPGPFLKYLINWTEEARAIHKILRLSGPDKRMADVELALRFLGFKNSGSQYAGNLKKFLDDVTARSNTLFSKPEFKKSLDNDLESLELAATADMQVFGENNASRKWKGGGYDTPFNRAVFDIQISSLSNPAIRKWATNHPKEFEAVFIGLCRADRKFLESLETTTKSISAVSKRFGAWYNALAKVSGLKIIAPFVLDATSN